MIRCRLTAALLALFGSVCLGATAARAADIPCRTAKLIVPWGPGGGTAIIFELITEAINTTGLEPRLQVVTIPGQGGNKGAKVARRAKSNGCTLFAMHQSAITSYLSGRVDFTWDAFEPVAMLTSSPSIIGTNKSVAYDDLAGLLAAAESAPGKVLAGSTLGSTSHYFFLLVEQAAGIQLKHVSYEGTRQRLTALLAETIAIGEINVVAAQKYIEDDELKALGIATEERDPRVPGIRTLREQGIDVVFGTERGVVLPKGAPAEIVAFYEQAFLSTMTDPELRGRLEAKGIVIRTLGSAAYRRHLEATFATLKAAAVGAGMFEER